MSAGVLEALRTQIFCVTKRELCPASKMIANQVNKTSNQSPNSLLAHHLILP